MTASISEVLEGRARWAVVTGDCLEVLPTLPDKSVDHCLEDPPYSERTHAAAAAAAAARNGMPDGGVRRVYASQTDGFGFAHITPGQRRSIAVEVSRLAKRWSLTFTDQEGAGDWMESNIAAGLDHIRIGQWLKIGGWASVFRRSPRQRRGSCRRCAREGSKALERRWTPGRLDAPDCRPRGDAKRDWSAGAHHAEARVAHA